MSGIAGEKSVRSGPFEDLLNLVTAGYGRKEDLRALDKQLREGLYSQLMTMRHHWEKLYLSILQSGRTELGRDCKEVIQSLDIVAERIQRGDYGYAPLFDRVSKVQEKVLSAVLEHDKSLVESVAKLGDDIRASEAAIRSTTAGSLESALDVVKEDLLKLEEVWDKRTKLVKG